jgi:hypothetical protein
MVLVKVWDEGIISNMEIKAYLFGTFLRRK